jgi:hypothetical protein
LNAANNLIEELDDRFETVFGTLDRNTGLLSNGAGTAQVIVLGNPILTKVEVPIDLPVGMPC